MPKSVAKGAKEWLLPCAALDRFNPPQNIRFGQSDSTDEQPVRYGYKIGSYGFLIEHDMMSEVIDEQKIFSMPRTDKMFCGLLNLRGNLVPVFDVEYAITNTSKREHSSPVLVLGESGNEVAMIIDDLPKPIYDTGNAGEVPEFPDNMKDYIKNGITQGDIDWVEFNCHGFFKAYAEAQS